MKGRIEIKSLEEGLKDFRATWKAVAAGKKVTPRKGTYFTSLEAARKVLTPKRLTPPRDPQDSARVRLPARPTRRPRLQECPRRCPGAGRLRPHLAQEDTGWPADDRPQGPVFHD